VESDDVLNVRDGPGVSNDIVDSLPFFGTGIEITGPAAQVNEDLWVPICFWEVEGWVNSRYLARQQGWVDEAVAARAAQIIMALKNRDLERLSSYVHPEMGVRFSPYPYVRAEQEPPDNRDLVFSADHIWNFFSDLALYHWGWFDGSGDPIESTFEGYWDRFIYDVDFARPHVVGYDEFIGWGNTVNNIPEIYPDAVIVEYHFEGFDPDYAGLDWKSLRLVLEERDGEWYLVGIVHAEWTI
jgi:hypothetical protein